MCDLSYQGTDMITMQRVPTTEAQGPSERWQTPLALQQPQSLMDFWVSYAWNFVITLSLSSPTSTHTYLFLFRELKWISVPSNQKELTKKNSESRILFKEATDTDKMLATLLPRPLLPDCYLKWTYQNYWQIIKTIFLISWCQNSKCNLRNYLTPTQH